MTQRGFHVTEENLLYNWLELGKTQPSRRLLLAVTGQPSSDGAVCSYHAMWLLFSPSAALKETAPSCCAAPLFLCKTVKTLPLKHTE